MKIVVTGGRGFIGRHLVDALAQSGHDVRTISRRQSPCAAPIRHFSCAVESPEAREFAQGTEVLVHLAGLPDASASLADPTLFARVNSFGTLNMLEAARSSGALFVLASSQRVYRPKLDSLNEDDPLSPSDPYGYSKLIAEKWVEMYRNVYGLRTVVLRFFSVFGPGQEVGAGVSGVVSIFMDRALAGKKLLVKNANLRDFTYVSDVVNGIMLCVNRPEAVGNTFNCATGIGTTVMGLATLAREITGSASDIEVTGDATDECLVANVDRIRQTLGYRPEVSLRRGLEQYCESLRSDG